MILAGARSMQRVPDAGDYRCFVLSHADNGIEDTAIGRHDVVVHVIVDIALDDTLIKFLNMPAVMQVAG